ncbi:MAG: penicillin-binding protein 2 [Inquilinus sp.]|nr:penicillin-binding protein 2 [Inquilinus sp.]
MERDSDRFRCLSRRSVVLAGMKLALLGTLAGRMYYLQVTESPRFRMLAEENRINTRLLAPSRGLVIDRFGVPLAVNEQDFRLVLVAEQAGDAEATLTELTRYIPLDEQALGRILRDLRRKPAFVPVTVLENLSWEEVSRIEVNTPELPGLSIHEGELRHYPAADATAHLLGYVSAVNEADLTDDPVLTLPGFRIGKTGVERQLDLNLRGEAGTSQVEVNAVGRVIRELSREEGTPGAETQLTIDSGLQRFMQNRLAERESASAVALDIETGEIYAMASSPSFDPNDMARGIKPALWSGLLNDKYHPLTNKAIDGQYAPGSTFKVMVALAALEAGVVRPNQSFTCNGSLVLGNHRFHCWRKRGHGRMDMLQGIGQSCDVYFYEVAKLVGIDLIAEMAQRFGLGRVTGIDMPGEKPGIVPTRAWKLANIGERWQGGETLVTAIGQGFMLSTPLQMAKMTAQIANGGYEIQPHVVRRMGPPRDPAVVGAVAIDTETRPLGPSLGVSPESLKMIVDGMVEVTSGPRGTARGSQLAIEHLRMAGKTGTSQVRRITAEERAAGVTKNEDLPWERRDHGLFIGFAPVHAPRYATAVVVEHGGGGSSAAAPIARDVLRECQLRNIAGRIVSAGLTPPGTREG